MHTRDSSICRDTRCNLYKRVTVFVLQPPLPHLFNGEHVSSRICYNLELELRLSFSRKRLMGDNNLYPEFRGARQQIDSPPIVRLKRLFCLSD
jgi:hypothetical protein